MGAVAGSAKAMANAGRCYFFGQGISPDFQRAYEYLHTAMKLGEREAAIYIGNLCRDGKYVEQDRKRAAYYYRSGEPFICIHDLKNCHPVRMSRLGETYFIGYDCDVDLIKAEISLQRALAVLLEKKESGQLYYPEGLARTDALLRALEMKKAKKDKEN